MEIFLLICHLEFYTKIGTIMEKELVFSIQSQSP